jgi:drug/metabolite transporter (DMT)-like permease
MNKLLLLIPAAGDFFTSTLVYASLNFIPGSVYQMLRGGGIATTFFFSVVFLRAKVLKHQVAGSILALLGITIVGLSNLAFSDGGGDSASGVILM